MSNNVVGNVYQQVIEEVISASRVDFEEGGVEDGVLEELKRGWQQKLSQLEVASFPWDPKPDPPQPAASAQPPTAAAQASSQQQQQGPAMQQQQQPQHMYQQQQQQHPQAQYTQATMNPAPNAQQQGFKNSQTDGAGDEDEDEADDYDEVQGILMQRDKAGTLHELGRVEIDGLLHQQFLSKAKAMEGGGLMLPLKETSKSSSAVTASRKGKERAGGVAQYDGEDDEDGPEIADEDAINSDLDDSDDEKDDDEVDDEGLGHIMLCMYDKVQRVKNKWKCVLKDGVLTVNGKEYVFHKATGEYEW
ncbi:Fumarylacetoacetate hydrolase domain-containing protein 2 [Verticillium dahliae VDG1]|nr:Fumarylacetoacetate hydrolase domain-containing protein 2 [Verticillium dahliae VDG1]